MSFVPAETIVAVAPNFKFRLSGVTTTLERAVPAQRALGMAVAALGPGLSAETPRIRFRDLAGFWRAPPGRPFRIWHARRNVEMLAGLVLRDLLRMKIRCVFTSAAQREHSGWTRFLIRRMEAVIATSARSARYLEVPATVIQHGIDLSAYSPAAAFSPREDAPLKEGRAALRESLGLPPDLQMVGCFGRIRPQKGTDLAAEALMRLLPARPGWMGVFSGRATAEHQAFQADLEAKIEAAGLEGRIRFLGEVDGALMPKLFAASDLYLAPQRHEGFGVTPLEAMASGAAVVATTAGAFPELVADGETGSLVPTDDLEALTAAMARWMDDDSAREAAGAAGRTRALERFDLAHEAEAINALYERIWAAASPSFGR